MSRISNLLAQILSATYGRDVRQSIHDAIEECYSDVSNAKTLADSAATSANTAAANATSVANHPPIITNNVWYAWNPSTSQYESTGQSSQAPASRVETVSGYNPVITAEENTRYMCGRVYSVNFTPAASGLCELVFQSGPTASVLTLPATVQMPEWWDGVEPNYVYEISILDGVYGVVAQWPV
jgi:hypothetical protein